MGWSPGYYGWSFSFLILVLRLQGYLRTGNFFFPRCVSLFGSQQDLRQCFFISPCCPCFRELACVGYLSLGHGVRVHVRQVLPAIFCVHGFADFLDVVFNVAFSLAVCFSFGLVTFDFGMFTFLFRVFVLAVFTGIWPLPVVVVLPVAFFRPCWSCQCVVRQMRLIAGFGLTVSVGAFFPISWFQRFGAKVTVLCVLRAQSCHACS